MSNRPNNNTTCYLTARNQRQTVLNALLAGDELSSKQLLNAFRIPRYRALIAGLRAEGFPIYSNRAKSNGQTGRPVTTYRLGAPSRAMVAAAYNALGASAFGG